jgi:hypothetical protein
MVTIIKLCDGEVYDTYAVIAWGRGTPLSHGFYVPRDADASAVITTLLLSNNLVPQYEIV